MKEKKENKDKPTKADNINQTNSKVEKKEVFNGSFGFVIKPDSETQQRAKSLVRELFPKAEFQTAAPHITLYHGRVESLPAEVIRNILSRLRKHNKETLSLKQIEIYGGKFAFWNNEITSNLRLMHEQSLEVAQWLDKFVVQRAVEEGLSMSQEELENIKKFGHPLVGKMFKPHLTLAYHNEGLIVPAGRHTEPWQMEIEDIFFTEIGKYGSVAGIVEF